MMNKKKDLRSSAGLPLMVLMAAVCVALRLWLLWDPAAILPKPDVSLWTTLSVIAVLAGQRMKPRSVEACGQPLDVLWAAVAFAVFPLCAGLLDGAWTDVLKLALVSAAVYGVTVVVMNSMGRRIRLTGGGALSKTGRLTLAVNGLLLILAVQAFNRIFSPAGGM